MLVGILIHSSPLFALAASRAIVRPTSSTGIQPGKKRLSRLEAFTLNAADAALQKCCWASSIHPQLLGIP